MSEVAAPDVFGQLDEGGPHLGRDRRVVQPGQGLCGQLVDVLLNGLTGPRALEELTKCIDILVADRGPNPVQELGVRVLGRVGGR